MNNKGTQHQFGYEWNLYREILPIYKEQFCHWIAPLDLAFFQDKTLLDAGCGIEGRSITNVSELAARKFTVNTY